MPGTYVNHNQKDDPFDILTQPPEPAKFWGQVKDIETFSVGFPLLYDENGKPIPHPTKPGKQKRGRPEPYDATRHDFEAHQVRFVLLPLDPTRPIKEIEIGVRNTTNPEFLRIVKPAVEKLGEKICQLRTIPFEGNNMWHGLVGLYIFGEYIDRPWDKDWQTLQFQDVFLTEQECQAHQNAMRAENGDAPLPFPENTPQVTQQAAQPQHDPMRATMANFLPALWDTSGKNPVQFLSALAQNPMLAQYFTAASPEVQAILAQANVEEEIPF